MTMVGHASPLRDAGGTIRGCVGAFLDITERKHAIEQLRESEERFAETMPVLISLSSVEDSTIKFVNTAYCEAFGYRMEDIIGRKGPDVYYDPNDRNKMLEIIKEQGFVTNYQIKAKKNDGTPFWLLSAIRPIVFDGKPAIIGASIDITERKKAEEALQEANTLLKQRNEELDSYNYSVSHDLRGPLRAVDAFSKLLAVESASTLNDEAKDYLGQITRATDRMVQITDDLLKLSRISRAELKLSAIDLGGLAKSIAEELKRNAPKREAEIKIEDAVVYGDTGLMRIVIENLLGNAWKFTSKKPNAQIEFASRQEGEKIICFVRDNGEGFNMAHSGKLFAPFRRLHTESEFPGTGIGLAIVRRILERHGGRVWAEGEVGVGATIYFELPAHVDIKETGGGRSRRC
jgi:PAS domain S-box-containing protein